ncbi:MAG: CDP-alcohol phosphatidyltransferase family protein [Gammaproteobacteria bacterium]|nr:CDP-alcohol phosphatidyltransferase family protein [Gammaproteobacteria bacterium]
MFTTYNLKPRFQDRLRPAVRFLAGARVHPNQVTIAALVLSCATGALLAQFHPQRVILLILAPVLFLRMALNAIDGMLAREHGMATQAGMILNELGDVASDAALYLPLAAVPGISGPAVFAFVLLAAQVEMAGVVAALATGRRSCAGPMGKSDRALAVSALGLVLGSGLAPITWSTPVLWLLDLLLVFTLMNRVRDGLRSRGRRGSPTFLSAC